MGLDLFTVGTHYDRHEETDIPPDVPLRVPPCLVTDRLLGVVTEESLTRKDRSGTRLEWGESDKVGGPSRGSTRTGPEGVLYKRLGCSSSKD